MELRSAVYVDAEGTRKFAQALLELQRTDLVIRPRPWLDMRAMLTRKDAFKERMLEFSRAREEALDVFADVTGSSRGDAEVRLRPLLEQVCLISRVDWGREVFRFPHGIREMLASDDRVRVRAFCDRTRALNQAAVEALARVYLQGDDAADPLVAETQVAWKQVREEMGWKPPWKRRPDRAPAKFRYWSLWRQWARSQGQRAE